MKKEAILSIIKRLSPQDWLALSLTITSMLLVRFFPAHSFSQRVTLAIAALFLIPTLYIKMVLKKPIISFGLKKPKDWIRAGALFGGSLALTVLILWILNLTTNLAARYSVSSLLVNNFWSFVRFELIWTLLSIVLLEFFRGFVIFSLKKSIKYYVLVIQFILFFLFALAINGNFWDSLSMIFAAIFGSAIIYFTESIYLAVAYSAVTTIILDAIAIRYRMLIQ